MLYYAQEQTSGRSEQEQQPVYDANTQLGRHLGSRYTPQSPS